MLITIFFFSVLLVSIELAYIGKVTGFLQKKLSSADLIKLLSSALIPFVFMYAGVTLGKFGIKYTAEYTQWYAATVFFILGVKLFYDGFRLHKIKQIINPLQNRGLLILAILTGINSFFAGLGFGLLNIKTLYVFYAIALLFTGILWGYFTGFTTKKLNSHQYEFFLGIIYIIIAIFIIIKN